MYVGYSTFDKVKWPKSWIQSNNKNKYLWYMARIVVNISFSLTLLDHTIVQYMSKYICSDKQIYFVVIDSKTNSNYQ